MKKILSLLLSLIILLFALVSCGNSGPGQAESLPPEDAASNTASADLSEQGPVSFDDVHPALWRVTAENGGELYLFGTIHVGDEHNDAALANLMPYLGSCDSLAVEFDALAYENDLEQQMNDIVSFIYTDGTTVEDHMPHDLFERTKQFLAENGLYVPMMETYSIALWSQLVEQALLMESDLQREKAMDLLLIDEANENGMEILELESAAFQYGVLLSAPDEYYVLALEETLDNAELYNASLMLTYVYWYSGNVELLAEVLNEENGGDYTEEEKRLIEDFNKKLIDERNAGMVEKAIGYLQSGKKVFLAVGAGHMCGETGIVKSLERAGYTVTRVEN